VFVDDFNVKKKRGEIGERKKVWGRAGSPGGYAPA